MSDQTWYYIDDAGAQHGPITIPQLQALVANGEVKAETQLWTEALGEQWIPATNVEGLLPATPAAAPTLARPTLATPARPALATPGLATPAPATPEPAASPEPTTPEPDTPAPAPTLATPKLATPAPATAEPAASPATPTPQPSAPEPAPAAPTLATPGSASTVRPALATPGLATPAPATPAQDTSSPSTPVSVASPTIRTATPVTTPDNAEIQQPTRAATTPMIPSTPTTQAVRGVPVPPSSNAPQQVAQQAPQQGAENPYQSPAADPQQLGDGLYPATIKKGGSMGLWCMLVFGGMLCIALGMMVAGMFAQGTDASADGTKAMIGLGLVLLGYGCFLFSVILTYIYLYRAWKCLQPGGATVSPGAAIGFLFIPLFNIYWVFKAVGGLPKQWNLITSSYPNTKNAPKLSIGAFICLLLIPFIGQIIWLSQITKGLNFMAGLHFQQSRPAGSALAGLGSNANFQ